MLTLFAFQGSSQLVLKKYEYSSREFSGKWTVNEFKFSVSRIRNTNGCNRLGVSLCSKQPFALFLNFLVVSFNLILFLNPGGLGFTSLGPTTIRWLFIK